MTAVVFLGPSLGLDVARSLLDADFRPPAVRGDIDRLLENAPGAIGLIDGGHPAVSPKEILRALDAGVAVYGSSGAGALRAVECVPFGMVGVGRVYEEYASGRVDADHEVSVAYDPSTFQPLTVPLIDLRLAGVPFDEEIRQLPWDGPSATRDDAIALLALMARA